MTWQMNDKEFESVLGLPAPRRYEYFIKRVADWEAVWSLASGTDEWVLSGDDEGNEGVPVWPHERFASACAVRAWSDTTPQAIPLREFMEAWLPGMADDGRAASVFLRPDGDGMWARPERVLEDLKSELSLIED